MSEEHLVFLLCCSLFGLCIIGDLIMGSARKRTPPGG